MAAYGALFVGRISAAPSGNKNHEAQMIRVENISKTFVLHQQNGVRLPVLQNATREVKNDEGFKYLVNCC